MDPGLRTALLACGLVFVGFFAYLTVAAIINDGFDFLSVISLVIIAMIGRALIGVLSNPPR